MSKPIIFLDFDGVIFLGDFDQYGKFKSADNIDATGYYQANSHYMHNLRRIVKQSKADIVISSSWRIDGFNKLRWLWQERKYPGEIVGLTPRCSEAAKYFGIKYYDEVDRGHEIEMYIRENKIRNYVILDDDNDMLPWQRHRFVRTGNNYSHSDAIEGCGLTTKCAKRAIEVLNNI